MENIINIACNVFQLLINSIILCFLALVTLVEILDSKGVNVRLFNYSVNKREREKEFIAKIHKETRKIINQFFENDYGFIIKHEEERINSFLVQIGLKSDEFSKVKAEILKLRAQRLCTESRQSMEKYLRDVCMNKHLALTDQEGLEKIKYPKVRFYINLVDVMLESSIAHNLAKVMAGFIYECIGYEGVDKVDKVIVSTEGNIFLGLKVGEMLKKPVRNMKHEGVILENKYWDGEFGSNERVIIVHDVLVTADQIFESIGKFPDNTEVLGIFNLVCRTQFNGTDMLRAKGYKVYSILSICDDDILKYLEKAEED